MDNFLMLLDVLKNGIIICILLGLTASMLSPFIVLNEQSLIADGLSHVSFTALAIGLFFFEDPYYLAIPIAAVASILVKWISTKTKIQGDAALGMVSSFGFAIGLIVIRYSNSNIDLESLISGNLWLRTTSDVYLSLTVFLLVGIFILVFYRKMVSLTYDFGFARLTGIKANLLSYAFAVLTSLFVVVGVRSIGVLLISSLLIFPVVTSNILAKNFKSLILLGILISVVVVLFGITFAHILNVPAGSMIVISYVILFMIISLIKKLTRGHIYD
ncbi:metal ABC transporter permease [Acholeplasma equirhinis]|uniref:metal ABC transporter permease n=1 Tax=Acholeplasma equirhinis TaxID=555393 RepID=UPI00197B03E2|nr:metal ABC transporter permease [Acholeplasma equirhinis]MBN3489942.1 metal ABC transporter permease [Acholeplasma equirhinis]